MNDPGSDHGGIATDDLKRLIRVLREQLRARGHASGTRRSLGFDAPRFKTLAEIAARTPKRWDDLPPAERSVRARDLAETFWQDETERTDRSRQGGALGNVVAIILLGARAEKVRSALQGRVEYWKIRAEAGDETAERYIAVTGKALKDAKGDAAATHYGRPARLVKGISITTKGGTNRDSQLAEAARLYQEHGDTFLDPEVLDAFLDNGGKVRRPHQKK